MEHLTVDEIIDFVSLNTVDEESMKLISKVNGHIIECAECRKKVRAFQDVYDEFVSIGVKNSSQVKEEDQDSPIMGKMRLGL